MPCLIMALAIVLVPRLSDGPGAGHLFGIERSPAVLQQRLDVLPDVTRGAEGWVGVAYAPVPGADPERLLQPEPPAGWRPQPELGLDDGLPYGWPEKYVEVYGQRFAPSTFAKNASALCGHLRKHPADVGAVSQLAGSLAVRLLEHSTSWNGTGLLVRYGFAHDYRDETLPPGWVSAYANGRAVQGLVQLGRCLDDDAYVTLAYRYFAPLSTRSPVTFVGDGGYVWFEEAPLPGGRAPMVLNGHVTAVAGLYYLYEWGGRHDDVLRSWQAGVASAKRFVPAFRQPGGTNRYDLMEPPVDDYGPERTVRQQRALFEMTGDAYFSRWARTFARDVE